MLDPSSNPLLTQNSPIHSDRKQNGVCWGWGGQEWRVTVSWAQNFHFERQKSSKDLLHNDANVLSTTELEQT